MSSWDCVSSLQSLCLDNLTTNIVQHGERFKKYRNDETVYARYKTLQFLFTNDLIAKLFEEFGKDSVDGDLKKLKSFMFRSGESGSLEDWPCLELFLNEYTVSIFPLLNDCLVCERVFNNEGRLISSEIIRKELSEKVVSFIAARCKNLRVASQTFCFLASKRLEETIPVFKNLREVDLDQIQNDRIIIKIFETCFFIRKLSCRGPYTTAKCLLSLCNHYSPTRVLPFCPENGNCSKAGKYLENLRIPLPKDWTTAGGIACALHHLPVLKSFNKVLLNHLRFKSLLTDVPSGIMRLQRAALANGCLSVLLELRYLTFTKNLSPVAMRTVLSSCPKLETLEVDLSVVDTSVFSLNAFENLKELKFLESSNDSLNSPELKQFLFQQGKQIRSVSFIGCSRSLDLGRVTSVLDLCCNLKILNFHTISIFNRNYDHLRNLPSCRSSIETISIDIHDINFIPSSFRMYFRKLLCSVPNLKCLEVGTDFTGKELPYIIEHADLKNLEELSIIWPSRDHLNFEKLLHKCRNLRKIEFRAAGAVYSSSVCRDVAKKCNRKLEIICE